MIRVPEWTVVFSHPAEPGVEELMMLFNTREQAEQFAFLPAAQAITAAGGRVRLARVTTIGLDYRVDDGPENGQ